MTSFLFHWNPTEDPESRAPFEDAATRGISLRTPWRCADHSAKVGDQAFVIRTGTSSRGIFAHGKVIGAPRMERRLVVDLDLDVVLRWEAVLPRTRLEFPPFDRYAKEVWSSRTTGVLIPATIATALSALWEEHLAALRSKRPATTQRAAEQPKPTAEVDELAAQVAQLLKANRLARPLGEMTPKRVSVTSPRYLRRADVIAWVLKEAKGTCEGCDHPAPFLDDGARPFLEVHHVRMLSDNGPDVIENAVALCPNCHRAMHAAKDKEERAASLRARHKRLRTF